LDHIHLNTLVVVVVLIQYGKAVLGMHDALHLVILFLFLIIIVVVELKCRTSVEVIHYVLIRVIRSSMLVDLLLLHGVLIE